MRFLSERVSIADLSVQRRYAAIRWLFVFTVFCHAIVDPILTYYRVTIAGTGQELNPLVQFYLAAGNGAYLLGHVMFMLFVSGIFWLLLWLVSQAEPAVEMRVTRWLTFGFSGLALWGVLLVGHHILYLIL